MPSYKYIQFGSASKCRQHSEFQHHQVVVAQPAEITMGSSEQYQPLLLGSLDSHSRIPDLSSAQIEEFLEHSPIALRWWPRLVAWESRLLWILSGASIVVSIFNYMLSFVTLSFCGHLSALELAGASIASVGIQGFAYGIMVCSPNVPDVAHFLLYVFFYLFVWFLQPFSFEMFLARLSI